MTTPRLILGLALLLPGWTAFLGQTPARTPVLITPHFAFYSDIDTNLNDALITAGIARKKSEPELFKSGPEMACFDELSPSLKAAWNGAVTYYSEIISPTDWTSRQQYLIRMDLAGFPDELKDDRARQFAAIASAFRSAARPAYAACRWTAQDEKNRRWIEDLRPLLAAHEEKIATELQRLYQKRWTALPIALDVVETVGWAGANAAWPTGDRPAHILISPSTRGLSSLELVFHESSHKLMERTDPLRQSLDTAAGAVDFKLPGDLWHVVLFYTTGEATRRIVDAGTRTRYTPILYEIFERGVWTSYRDAVEKHWRPYVHGQRTLAEASRDLIEAVRKPK